MQLSSVAADIPGRKAMLPSGEARLFWLGQAGFLLEFGGSQVAGDLQSPGHSRADGVPQVAGAPRKDGRLRMVIDAYLSDSLAKKYQDAEFPHVRLMPPPIAPEALRDIDYILCSHGHTDHMDAETIRPLVMNNPGCRVAAPLAEKAKADGMGLGPSTFLPLDAGMVLDLTPGVRLRILPAAHEEFKQDAQGHHHFLAFLLEFPGFAIFHGGDCVPYPGLADALEGHGIALSLLPVNGRDAYRSSRGILGNFTLQESAALARKIGSDYFIGHHFGLFDFNTIDRDAGAACLATLYPEMKDCYFLVEPGKAYILTA